MAYGVEYKGEVYEDSEGPFVVQVLNRYRWQGSHWATLRANPLRWSIPYMSDYWAYDDSNVKPRLFKTYRGARASLEPGGGMHTRVIYNTNVRVIPATEYYAERILNA